MRKEPRTRIWPAETRAEVRKRQRGLIISGLLIGLGVALGTLAPVGAGLWYAHAQDRAVEFDMACPDPFVNDPD